MGARAQAPREARSLWTRKPRRLRARSGKIEVLMPYSILLVDDHKILRDGIRTILERTADFHVVGEADSGSDAVSMSRKLNPDLVLMDIGLPGMNGIDATGEVLRHCPSTRVMMLSMYDDESSV